VRPATELAPFAGGFVAAEGCFTRAGAKRFRFAVHLGAEDASTCWSFVALLGVGYVHTYPRRKAHYDDETVFAVTALSDLVEVVVPFMDEHLPPSYKRQQYLAWRADLLDYWEHNAKRRRTCAVEGCPNPQRAKRVCRQHYYDRYGQ
jgi:hypothetical protein